MFKSVSVKSEKTGNPQGGVSNKDGDWMRHRNDETHLVTLEGAFYSCLESYGLNYYDVLVCTVSACCFCQIHDMCFISITLIKSTKSMNSLLKRLSVCCIIKDL